MIEARELRKEYGDFVAVEGSTFSVDDGEVFGIVGPNGAGKTTTLKMLAGLLDPTAGSATVAGFDAGETEMRRHLGFLPEESPLYEEIRTAAQEAGGEVVDIRTEESSLEEVFLNVAESGTERPSTSAASSSSQPGWPRSRGST